MSFEPRIIEDTEPAPEELPADLAELGSQLDADSRRLAASYPARGRAAVKAAPLWRRIGSRVAAVAAVAAVGLWAASRDSTAPQSDAGTRHESTVQLHRAKLQTLGASAAPVVPVVSPAMWFESLNAQEQEGLLDIFEDQSVRTTSISL